MPGEIKKLAKGLKKLIASANEEDLIVKVKKTAPKRAPAPKAQSAKGAVAIAAVAGADKGDKAAAIAALAAQINACKRCPLGSSRIKAVPGEGNINARLMFVGEGPGYEEDRQGRPFVGRAGQLLDKIIEAMGFKREEVFIANMVKCHPMTDPSDPQKRGNDRAPDMEEIALCRRYIEQQIKAISPQYIVALGGVAAKSLIMDTKNLSSIRGKLYNLELTTVTLDKPVKILATYHPAALLRNPGWKKDAWADLKVLLTDMK